MPHTEIWYRYQFDFFRLGLLLSVVKKTEIINWADDQLLTENWMKYSATLAELSLSQEISEKELIALLTTIIGSPTSTLTGSRLLLGRLYALQDLKNTISKLKRFIPLMRLSEKEEEKIKQIYFHFNADYHLSPMTLDCIQQAQKDALLFLQNYQDYTFQNLQQLTVIEQKLTLKLLNGYSL
ncbi:MAG: hypothetical protein ACRBFS_18285 [Aureispira sp.]